MFGTVHAQENGCCVDYATNPMSVVTTPEGTMEEEEYGNNDDNGGGNGGEERKAALVNKMAMQQDNYFDYDANIDVPLSPQGVASPQERHAQALFLRNKKNNGSSSSSRSNNDNWKSRVNRLLLSVSKHTCRCFGEPYSTTTEGGGGGGVGEPGGGGGGGGEKWNLLSSATTAATSTTAANTSTAAAQAQQQVRKMQRTPMFSMPVVV